MMSRGGGMTFSTTTPDNFDRLMPKRRVLPKLLACMTKQSLENMRNKALFSIDALDAKGIRRRKLPLYECLILELKECGYTESSNYLQDLLYDNAQLVAEDDIGIVVDLRNRNDYLEHICSRLQVAERERERQDTKKECAVLLGLAVTYAEKGKGILWLAEKFYLVSIAVASRYLIDGGRLKGVCKYFYAKFLLDKFPGADTEEPFEILTEVRDSAIGKVWPLYEPTKEGEVLPKESLFAATALQLHRVLIEKARLIRKNDPAKAERLSRLAERRGQDANDLPKVAEAIIEVGICQLAMNNLNNAKKTFHRAFKVNTQINNIQGLCNTRMYLASVMQRLGDHEQAAQLLTEMGALAMENGLRRELGRALHLLGELHMRREKPELGTQHLTEAFSCFMGCMYTDQDDRPHINLDAAMNDNEDISTLGVIYSATKMEIYKEEAEQSRIMQAISAGQEIMASYFHLLNDARTCTVATVKCIEWKSARHGWWVTRPHHSFLPCLCFKHNRTPLDVLWCKLEQRKFEDIERQKSEGKSIMKVPGQRVNLSIDDVRKLNSHISDLDGGAIEENDGGKKEDEKTEGEKIEGEKIEGDNKEGDNKDGDNKEGDNEEGDNEEGDNKEGE